MASQRETFDQNLFIRGISQSKHVPEANSVDSMEGVDITSRYGVVSLGRLSDSRSAANNSGGGEIVGKNVPGQSAPYDSNNPGNPQSLRLELVFFSNWAYAPQNGSFYGVTDHQINTSTVGRLLHAVTVPEWGTGLGGVNIFVAYLSGSTGHVIYVVPVNGTVLSTALPALNPSTVPSHLKGLNPYTLSGTGRCRSIFLDGSLFLFLGNRLYKMDYTLLGNYTITEVLKFDFYLGADTLSQRGDSLYIYMSEKYRQVGQHDARNYRFIWHRTQNSWSQQDEIPGTLFDVINFNGIDILFWDDNIGYFRGGDLVVLQKIPQVEGKIVRPVYRSANVSGGFLTFMTVQLQRWDYPTNIYNAYEDDATGVTIWKFGRNRDDQGMSLQRMGVYYDGYQFVRGEMSGNGYGDVSFYSSSVRYYNIVDSNSSENSVEYFLFAKKRPSPSTDTAFLSFVQPIGSLVTATNYRGSGYLTTQEIGREFGERKRLMRIGVRAEIAEHTQVKVSVAVDGSDSFTEVAVFGPGTTNQQWMQVGSKGIPQFYTMQVRVELVSTNGTASPILYGVSAEYDRLSDS